MAKGNFMQGIAKGRLGDVVMWRQGGYQRSRIRIRNPRNPNTNAQLYQRAIVATIMQAYSAGKKIFDHSFEGCPRGIKNMHQFYGRNVRILRNLISQELNIPSRYRTARFVAPGIPVPVPVPGLQISNGTYPLNLFHINQYTNVLPASIYITAPISIDQTAADWFGLNGFRANDIYTIVGFGVDTDSMIYDGEFTNAQQYQCAFGFIRLKLRDLSSVTASVRNLKFNQIFDAVESLNFKEDWLDTTMWNENLQPTSLGFGQLMATPYYVGTFGIIRSRLNEDLRSTSFMYFDQKNQLYGLDSDYVLREWYNRSHPVGDSALLLEGGSE